MTIDKLLGALFPLKGPCPCMTMDDACMIYPRWITPQDFEVNMCIVSNSLHFKLYKLTSLLTLTTSIFI